VYKITTGYRREPAEIEIALTPREFETVPSRQLYWKGSLDQGEEVEGRGLDILERDALRVHNHGRRHLVSEVSA